ncbi:MAG: CAP domain-containing protein [Planctomycetes bacterium]|nr:CAP domain-containing protein [Planctomycetota bacterium]
MKKLCSISTLLTILSIFLINPASAEVIILDDFVYITCADRGNNLFEAFGEKIYLPEELTKKVTKINPENPRIDASSMQGGLFRAENLCMEANDRLQRNELDEAKKLFEQAFKIKRSNIEAQSGYLRFHIVELVAKVLAKPKDLKKTFKPFIKGGETVVKEYAIWQYLRIISMLSDEKQKKKIVSTVGRDVKSLRAKLLKLLKKYSKKNNDSIKKNLTLIKGIFYQPTSIDYFARNKYVKDHFKILEILSEIVNYYKISERYKVCADGMKKKLESYLKSSELGAYVNKKHNKLNLENREKNAKFSMLSSKEKAVLIELNDFREVLGFARLLAVSSLTKASSDHAFILNKHDKLTHKGKDGSSPAERSKIYGYKPKLIAENLQKIANEDDSAETIMMNWIFSQEHNENIMNSKLTEVGIGSAGKYWIQLFGIPE